MRILVACEFSGTVRRAFRDLGFDAWSCDLLPADDGDHLHHYKNDVLEILDLRKWDVLIAFPPCTHLAASGARWWDGKALRQVAAINFVRRLWEAPIPHIAIENPVGILSQPQYLDKPTQIIQPWQFGHGETKRTCLWLKGLPPLTPTDIVPGRSNRIHMMPDTKDRWKKRSLTYSGIAAAMASQWGAYLRSKALEDSPGN